MRCFQKIPKHQLLFKQIFLNNFNNFNYVINTQTSIQYICMFQEVRLSSMRKLHSECDFKQLSSGNYVAVTPCRPRLSLDDVNGELGGSRLSSLCSTPAICCRKPSIIDKYSRIFFPVSFLGFNLLYWVTYLNVSGMDQDEGIVLVG